MKKFTSLAIATIISLGSFTTVMATAPAPAVTMPFPVVSFEAAETGWNVTGPLSAHEVVTNAGVVAGTQALKVTATARQTADWNNLTKLNVMPAGQIWDAGVGNVIVATVTNPDTANDLQLRWNITDNKGNTRMMFFLIPAGQTKEIVVDSVRMGEPGVVSASWTGDGYAQKGFDPTCIKAMSFYVAEPELEKVMKGVTSPTYIIDNITVKPAPAAVPATLPLK